MKKYIIALLIISFGLLSFEVTKSPTTFSTTSNKMSEINATIIQWSKYGYKVKFIVSQTVGVSDAYDGSQYLRSAHSTIKGDILLVMEK